MIGIVTGTPLGQALAHRLREDGREIVAGADAAALREIGRAPLIVVDAAPGKLRQIGRALGDVTDGAHLLAHTVRGLVGGIGAIEML